MGKICIQSDKGELRLRKSKRLVGLRMNPSSRSLVAPDYVQKEIHPNLSGFQLVELETGEGTVEDKLDQVRQNEEVEVGTHVYFPEGSERPLMPTGELFLTFEPGVSEEEQQIVIDEFQLELVERRSEDQILVRVTARSKNPIRVAQLAQESCLVKLAQPDFDTLLDDYDFNLPADQLLAHQWYLQNNGFVPDAQARLARGADAKVVAAWKRLGSLGANTVTVALIDNGFDLSHPDLQGKVFRPFDLWSNSPSLNQGDPRYTHGTPCASIAIASSNGKGMVGVAPNARFMPVSGTSFSSRVTEQMFAYCVANGADIISCSWGTTDPSYRLDSIKEQAIARAVREGRGGKGCVVLYAVGNDSKNYVNFYAAHPDVIAVGASTSEDRFASYSNQGMEVTICAPSNGEWPLLAARAAWDGGNPNEQGEYRYWVDGRSRGANYKHFGGTSGATPLVAGICALMLSANPNLSAREVKEILIQTADKIGSPSEYIAGHSRKYGYGRVNAERAVAEALRRKSTGAGLPPTPSTPTSPVSTPASSGNAGAGGTTSPSGNLFEVNLQQAPKTGWGVQVGAFSSYDSVLSLVNQYKSKFGQPVFVHVSTANGKSLYKIIVGSFSTTQQAAAFQAQMQRNGVSGFVKNFADL
ncbi:MAG: hypothetical protein KIPDCIKN_01105 [Haliscomenobacter sp.]|jgi:subtilisin family serine protease|nr:hypothetical protein [Haliscomenobacter sp.]